MILWMLGVIAGSNCRVKPLSPSRLVSKGAENKPKQAKQHTHTAITVTETTRTRKTTTVQRRRHHQHHQHQSHHHHHHPQRRRPRRRLRLPEKSEATFKKNHNGKNNNTNQETTTTAATTTPTAPTATPSTTTTTIHKDNNIDTKSVGDKMVCLQFILSFPGVPRSSPWLEAPWGVGEIFRSAWTLSSSIFLGCLIVAYMESLCLTCSSEHSNCELEQRCFSF